MAVDYDTVILGGTPEAYEAARYGAQVGARVAWVLQGQDGRKSSLQYWGLLQLAKGFPPTLRFGESFPVRWRSTVQRAGQIAQDLTSTDFQQLLVKGIDVIAEAGHFASDRPLTVETHSRRLTTRTALIATGCTPRLPDIPGLHAVSVETPESFLRRETLPASVAILGGAPLALALCQILCRGGVPVTLITPTPELLGREDRAISQWMAAQLQADGVTLQLGSTVEAVQNCESGISLRLTNNTSVTAEALVVAAGVAPNLDSLNLEKYSDRAADFQVDRYLRTRHPRIYACGSVLGSDGMAAIARQEARTAMENALFWNRRPIDYCLLPYDLLTQPEIARVGLTEIQARRRYPAQALKIHVQYLYDTPKAHWLDGADGLCKLIAHRSGQVLGVHGAGPAANEWVQWMALMMAQKVPWWKVAQHPTLPHTLADILPQAAQRWQRDLWQPGSWRRDWAENWFNWRRSR